MRDFYGADELEFLAGKYSRVDESMAEIVDTGETSKILSFFEKIKN